MRHFIVQKNQGEIGLQVLMVLGKSYQPNEIEDLDGPSFLTFKMS
jgi:hypothetical protein